MMVDIYKPNISGVVTHLALNKQVLDRNGHKVFVFTFGDLDHEDDELYIVRSPGVALNIQDRGAHVSLGYSGVAQRKLKSMDVAHAHDLWISGPLALRYCKPRGIPVVYTNHTRYDLYAQHYLPHYIPDAVSKTLLQTVLPRFCAACDLVISPSNGIAEVMKGLGVTSPIRVIPNGIDLLPFQEPAQRFTRTELGLADEDVVLMYTGRLGPEKNLAFLLRSFFGVAATWPNVTLAIVGDGPEMENLKDQALHSGYANRVKFYGRVAYDVLPGYLKCADLFVTASETEVHPLSLIEAQAAGLPAVGIASPGVSDTIVIGESGLLSGPDVAEFTAKMIKLVLEADLRHKMASQAAELAKAYDINRTSAALLKEYERLTVETQRRLQGWAGVKQRIRNWLPDRLSGLDLEN
jgi:glycosyltransferase involved in cell wall biosynthesis